MNNFQHLLALVIIICLPISITAQSEPCGAITEHLENYADLTINDASRICLLYTSPSPRDQRGSRMPSSA